LAIIETVQVDVTGIGILDDAATAADNAAKAFARLQELAGKGLDFGAGAGGLDDLASSAEAAAARYSAAIDKMAESGAKLSDLGAAGAGAGLDKLAGDADAAAGSFSDSVDKMVAAQAKLADTSALDSAAAGPGKIAEAWTASAADVTAAADEMAAAQARVGASSADGALAVTAAQQAQADSKVSLAATSVQQDEQIAQSAKTRAAAEKQAAADSAAAAESSAKSHEMLALGAAAAAGYGIYEAAGLQQAGTRLYTSAGESLKNVPMVEQGILGMAGPTATSLSQLEQGAYWAESAGFHGQYALNVERAAAQGAYAEQAPLEDVTDAETSIENAYGMKNPSQQQANAVVNQMLTAVGQGKMTMAGLSGSLSSVLPTAANAGISLQQVLGSVASMTSVGTSPDQATQELRHAITSLQKPTSEQASEMQLLGINPVELAKNLGKEGLTGTVSELDDAINSHLNKSGMVMVDTLSQSRLAAQSANEEIAAMPPAIQGVAKAYLDGSVSAKQWNAELFSGAESAKDKNMLEQFATTANQALGFSTLVKSGMGDEQTKAGALNLLTGGQTGAQVAMLLGGANLGKTSSDVDKVADSAQHAGNNIQGWAQVQGNLNYQLKDFEYSLQATATSIGQVALPLASGALKGLGDVAGFFAANPEITKPLAVGGGVLGAGYLYEKLQSPVMTSLKGVGTIAEKLNIPGLDKLANIGQGAGGPAGVTSLGSEAGAAAGEIGALGAAAGRAAGQLDAAAAAKGGAAAAGEGEAAAGAEGAAAAKGAEGAEGEAAAAEEGAGGGLLAGGGLKSAGMTAGLGLLATATVIDPMLQSMKNKQGNWLDNAFSTPKSSGWNSWSGLGHDISDLWGLTKGTPGAPSTGTADPGYGRFGPAGASAPLPGAAAPAQPSSKDWTSVTGDSARYGATPPPSGPGGVPASEFATQPAAPGYTASPAYGRFGPAGASMGGLEQAASQPSGQDLLGTGGHPSAVTLKVNVDASGVAAAKGQVTADLNQLNAAATSMKPVKIPAPDLSALTAAKGSASADGAAVGAGFAAGIAGESGAAAAAGSELAAAAESAMKVHMQISSPSKVTEKIGIDTATGFAEGLTTGASAVKDASAEIGSNSVASLVEGLEGGQDNIQAATSAILGSLANPDAVSTIQQTVLELQQSIPTGDTGLVKWLTKQGDKLQGLANQQGAITAEISNAQQLATSAISGASVTSAYGYTPALAASSGPTASASIITGMQQQLADTKAFASTLAQLQKGGLNATTESQLAQAGTATGLPLAEGLEQGGKAAIAQMNSIQAQINKAAQSIGDTGGTAMYNAAQQVTAGLDAPLKAELKSLDTDMTKITDTMITTVERKLGTAKSSASSSSSSSTSAASTPAAAIAGSAGTSAASGLGKIDAAAGGAASGLGRVDSSAGGAASGLSAVATAAGGAASALSALGTAAAGAHSGGHAQAPGGGGYSGYAGSGGGGNVIIYHTTSVTVQGSVTTQQDLATSLQATFLEQADRNLQTGLKLRGRGA
jgi:hypothetical protein